MKHIPDGDLHAYLDGALEYYPEGEANRIREHLDRCESCGARLAEESALRQRAAEILAEAGPGEVVAPPLEELRRQAVARQHGGGSAEAGGRPGRLWRLGWAASIVLAVGAGWVMGYLPGTTSDRPVPVTAASDEAPVTGGAEAERGGEAEAAVAERRREAETVDEGRAGEMRQARSVPTDTESRLEAPISAGRAERAEGRRPAMVEAEERDRMAVARAPEPEADVSEPPSAVPDLPTLEFEGAATDLISLPDAPPVRTLVTVDSIPERLRPGTVLHGSAGFPDDIRAETSLELASRSLADRRVPSPPGVGESINPSSLRGDRQGEEPLGVTFSFDRAPGFGSRTVSSSDVTRLGIPDFTVESARWTTLEPGVEGVRIVQRSGEGTVQLRYFGLGEIPSGIRDGLPTGPELARRLERDRPSGWSQVVRRAGRGWLIAWGSMGRQRLRELVGRIPVF